MKIKNLTTEEKKLFLNELEKYGTFIDENSPKLSKNSRYLYKRTLSFMSVENKKTNLQPKDFCLYLTNELLEGDINCILGKSELNNSKNIRLSAFKNLFLTYKDYIIEKNNEIVFRKIEKILCQTGSIIRNKSKDEKKQKDDLTNKIDFQNWEAVIETYKNKMKEFVKIQNRYTTTGELPSYIICRDFLIASLLVNNKIRHNNREYNVILRNEYRNLVLYINSNKPPKDERNYIWIDLEKNKSCLYIQKSKTTGKYQKVKLSNGEVKKMVNDNVKIFPISNNNVSLILFIKNVFGELNNKIFFKTDNRLDHFTCDLWSKQVTKIFKIVAAGIGPTTLKKMYINHTNFEDFTKDELKTYFIYLDNLSEYKFIKEKYNLD